MEVFKDKVRFHHKYHGNPQEKSFLKISDDFVVSAQDVDVVDNTDDVNPLKLVAWISKKVKKSDYQLSHEFGNLHPKDFIDYSFWKNIPKTIKHNRKEFSAVGVLYQGPIVDSFDQLITYEHLAKEVIITMRNKGIMTSLYDARKSLVGGCSIDHSAHILNYDYLIKKGYKVINVLQEEKTKAFEILEERRERYQDFTKNHPQINAENFKEHQRIVKLPFVFKMKLNK